MRRGTSRAAQVGSRASLAEESRWNRCCAFNCRTSSAIERRKVARRQQDQEGSPRPTLVLHEKGRQSISLPPRLGDLGLSFRTLIGSCPSELGLYDACSRDLLVRVKIEFLQRRILCTGRSSSLHRRAVLDLQLPLRAPISLFGGKCFSNRSFRLFHAHLNKLHGTLSGRSLPKGTRLRDLGAPWSRFLLQELVLVSFFCCLFHAMCSLSHHHAPHAALAQATQENRMPRPLHSKLGTLKQVLVSRVCHTARTMLFVSVFFPCRYTTSKVKIREWQSKHRDTEPILRSQDDRLTVLLRVK